MSVIAIRILFYCSYSEVQSVVLSNIATLSAERAVSV